MKGGTIGNGNHKFSDHKISAMNRTKAFKRKYGKYLMKKILPPATIEHNLWVWHARYKVTASPESTMPAGGRLDPDSNKPLFMKSTWSAVNEQAKNAEHIQDPKPVEQMYRKIEPTGRTKHGLPEYISLRPESLIEQWHNPFSNYANTGTRRSLTDNLNLLGTAKWNLII
jgi:hypothetical protein